MLLATSQPLTVGGECAELQWRPGLGARCLGIWDELSLLHPSCQEPSLSCHAHATSDGSTNGIGRYRLLKVDSYHDHPSIRTLAVVLNIQHPHY